MFICCFHAEDVAAYGGATNLDYELGGLTGSTITWKDWWDPDSGWYYDWFCECSFYFEDWVSVVGVLYAPAGSAYAGAYTFDLRWAELDLYFPNPPQSGDWILSGDHYLERDWYDFSGCSWCTGCFYPPCYLGTDYFYLLTTRDSAFVPARGCGDERDQIIQEYITYGVDFVPACSDFTQNASSQHFSFAELNTGDYIWAIIRGYFLTGLEATRSNYGNPMIINSAYRNPARNARVGGAPNSRHMHGDAADIAAGDCDAWNRLADAACRAGAWVEPRSQSGVGHVHMDWGHATTNCPQRCN